MSSQFKQLPITGGTGVSSLNSLAGAVVIAAGSGISLTPSGNTITIANTGASGTVTSVSVATANGFAGTVANASTTPAITLTTSITGLLQGNGTAISAATAGTDYVVPGVTTLSFLSLPYSQVTGGPAAGADTALDNLSAVAINTGLIFAPTVAGSIQTANEPTPQSLTIKTGQSTDTSSTSGGLTLQSANSGGSSLASGAVTLASGPGNSSGNVTVASGYSGTLDSGSVTITTGEGSNNSGNISLLIGLADGGTQGNIKFLKTGVASVSGQVWTASATDGTGYWDNASANILVIESTAHAAGAGATNVTLLVPGLLLTDTILSVSQKTPATVPTSTWIGWGNQQAGSIDGSWTAEPGGGATFLVAIKR